MQKQNYKLHFLYCCVDMLYLLLHNYFRQYMYAPTPGVNICTPLRPGSIYVRPYARVNICTPLRPGSLYVLPYARGQYMYASTPGVCLCIGEVIRIACSIYYLNLIMSLCNFCYVIV